MKLGKIGNFLPTWQNALLAVLAAVLLILAFPDFELWFLAWVALVPLLFAIERERRHSCRPEREAFEKPGPSIPPVRLTGSWRQECRRSFRSFLIGWIFGNIFFFGTCWWLTYAPITYAGFPPLLAYFLLFCVTSIAAIFPGIFGLVLSVLLRRFGSWAFILAPFVWVFTEFLRYWLTGNNWNAIGYSQALAGNMYPEPIYTIAAELLTDTAMFGGVIFTSFLVLLINSAFAFALIVRRWKALLTALSILILVFVFSILVEILSPIAESGTALPPPSIVAIQPNVPMAGLNLVKWTEYRRNHVRLAESEIQKLTTDNRPPTTVIFPESPMNFMYGDDPETKAFIDGFAAKNNVSVLFNSAEPDAPNGKFYNSAVMVSPEGKEIAQYDKIFLLPFGEAVPIPLEGILPGFVGNFSYGKEYGLLPVGDAKAGVMICFESHFGQLSRKYVRNGADVIIEMTNDGYLGPTPVLRQHLANAVFRAVETSRPVLRVTNVGITAYINERGEVLDSAEPYTEAARVWSVAKSDGSQTFYVRYGDWFAWLCSIVTVGLLILGFVRRNAEARA